MSKEPCQKSVPIFPVRYSVKPEEEGKGVDGAALGFPPLKHSNYTLRLLREGFVYLYDAEKKDKGLHIWEVKKDGTFQKITAKNGSIITLTKSVYDKENKFYELEGRTTPYILARAKATEVYIGFSDALWTADIFKNIKDNTKNARTNLMTQINVDKWDASMHSTVTFGMDTLEQYVEEYKGNKSSWSSFQTQKPVSLAKSLKDIMDAYPTSETKSIGVMLNDNIGLVVDQGGIVDKNRKILQDYLQKDNSTHKKIISDCVEMVYKMTISEDKNMKYDTFVDSQKRKVILDRKLEKDENIQNSWLLSLFPNMSVDESREIYGDIKVKNSSKFENAIFKYHAKDRMRNIDEKARLKFLKNYDDGYKILAKKLMESKNDRWEHLYTYIAPTKASDLGSSFLNYDVENKISADLHGQAFSFCITDMMSDPYNVEDVINKEHDLFAGWMELPKGDDPLLNAMVWAYDNKPDTMMGAIDALAKLPFSKMDSANTTLQERTQQQLDELDSQHQKENSTLSEHQGTRSKLEKTIADEMDKLHAKYSNVEISKNIATYILTKPKTLNGAALIMGNRKFSEYIYSNNPDKGDLLVSKVLDGKLSYHRPENLQKIYLSPQEYESKLSESANLTTHETKRFHFEDAHSTTPVQDSVSVLTKEKPFVFSVVNNTNILDTQLNIRNMGQAVQGASKSIDDISSRIEGIAQHSREVENVFHKEYNPFVTKLNRGLSPLVILANAINLSRAMTTFKSDDPIEIANLTAAITGSVAALLYGIDSFRTKTSTVQIVADMKVEPVATSRFFQYLSLDLGMKVFGGIAVVADARTQYLKGKKVEKEDNNEARDAYYLSALLLFGGVLALASSPILILIGVVSVLGGMYALAVADDLVWDDIDKWLNACVWRKRGADARVIPGNNSYGENWNLEYSDFVRFYFNPKIANVEWKTNVKLESNVFGMSHLSGMTRELNFELYLPIFVNENIRFGYSFRKDYSKQVISPLAKTMNKSIGEIKTIEYEIELKSAKVVKFKILKIPNSLDIIDFSLEWKLIFNNKTYGLLSFFSLDKSIFINESKAIKTIYLKERK